MPWSASDARRHKHGLNPTESKAWAEIANNVLERTGDEGQAIRVANSKSTRAKKAINYNAEQARAAKKKALSKVPKKGK